MNLKLPVVKVKKSYAQIRHVIISKAFVAVGQETFQLLKQKTWHQNTMGITHVSLIFLKEIGQFLQEMESVCGGIDNIAIGG